MSRSRTRRIAKWTGLVVCVVTMVGLVASNWRFYRWTSPKLALGISGGGFIYADMSNVNYASPNGWGVRQDLEEFSWWFKASRWVPGLRVWIWQTPKVSPSIRQTVFFNRNMTCRTCFV